MKIVIPLGPGESKFSINKAYVEYVYEAGYEPFAAIPQNNALQMAEICDGLLLPGGKDIDPIYYNESNWSSYYADSEKDDFERQLFWAFLNHNKPVFGICRGFQLIAREYIKHTGSQKITPSSKQTVEDRLIYSQDIRSHDGPGSFNVHRTRPHHYVSGRVDALYGAEEKSIHNLPVNSMHHQYLHANISEKFLEKSNKITQHMYLSAWTRRGLDKDELGVVCEGIVIKGWAESKIAGVQWHPEELKDYNLLHHFFGQEAEITKSDSDIIKPNNGTEM